MARDLLSEWSALLVESLLQGGVRDFVVSPGSRSTPFVLAAAGHPEVRCWDVLDERSAAFFALGQAKASGRPSLALCTSGTAGAHYFPAVVEAAMSFTPLLVLTADRPLELQGCGAPQTVDQVKLFGDRVRGFFELGLPDGSPSALRGLRRLVAQAIHASRWPTPGPVHLNARARKPLEPREADGDAERRIAERVQILRAEAAPRIHPPRSRPSPEALDALAGRLAAAERPLVVAGPAPSSQGAARSAVAELVRRSGAVLLREAASQLRSPAVPGVDGFDVLLDAGEARTRLMPDLVLQLGAAPTSAALASHLGARPGLERWVAGPHGWNDPENAAAELVVGEIADVAEGLVERLPASAVEPSPWQRRWQGAEAIARRVLDEVANGPFSEGVAVRILAETLEPDATLFVGNSLAIRELDLFCPARAGERPLLSQRGANGIDGLVSGAAGAASATGRVTLLLGDVSFLHDVGGLWAARLVGSRLTVVVLHNQGGRIFEDLPLGRAGVADAMRHFTTPHALGLAAAAALYGLEHRRASGAAELRAALVDRGGGEKARLIEVAVPPEGLGRLRGEIVRRLSAELGGTL